MSTDNRVFSPTKFRKARKEAGITMDVLADQIGVTRTAISYWENGKNAPAKEKIELLEMVLKRELTVSYDEDFDFIRSVTDNSDLFKISELISKQAVKRMLECMEMSGDEGDYAGFITDCIYRRWTDLKQSEVLVNEFKKREKTNKNKLEIDENN